MYLGKLLDSSSTKEFTENISKKPFIRRNVLPDISKIVSVDDLDRLLSITGVRPPFVSLINGKTGLRTSDYKLYFQSITSSSNPSVILKEIIHSGTTIIFQHIHLLHPGVQAIVSKFEELFHPMPIQTNCYLTPSSAQGVFPHVDQHHTLLIQISGSKKWCVWENIDRNPNNPMITSSLDGDEATRIADSSDPILSDWVNPGDAIHIPRGFIHTPYTGNAHSIHLTMGIIDPGEKAASELVYKNLISRKSLDLSFEEDVSQSTFGLNNFEQRVFMKNSNFVEIY